MRNAAAMVRATPTAPEQVEGPALPDQARPDWVPLRAGRPLHCEIGAGRGHFALDTARAGEVGLVAIEQRRSDCDALREKRDRLRLGNLEIIQGDARLLVPRLFADGSVEAFHIHCPDPWWKGRHHRRRLIAEDFGIILWRLLEPGGTIDLRTDVREYARAIVETFEDILGFENPFGPGQERPVEGLVLSTRERRYAISGQPVYRYLFRRPGVHVPAVDLARAWQRRQWTDVRRK
jgi:tRNA (guanine-N7-)-methyltransferase